MTQQDSPQPSLQLPLQRTQPLPEPQLVSRPLPAPMQVARSMDHSPYGLPGWDHLHHKPTQAMSGVFGPPWYKPNITYGSSPQTQSIPVLPPFSQPSPTEMTAPRFLPPPYPFHHSQPPLLPSPMASQETQLTFPSLPPAIHPQPIFQVVSPQPILPHLVYHHPPDS